MNEQKFKRPGKQKKSVLSRSFQIQRFVSFLVLGLFLWFFFSFLLGDHGVFKIIGLNREVDETISHIEELKRENEALEEEVGKLQSDLETIEEIGRTEYDLVRENEIVYKFHEESPPR